MGSDSCERGWTCETAANQSTGTCVMGCTTSCPGKWECIQNKCDISPPPRILSIEIHGPTKARPGDTVVLTTDVDIDRAPLPTDIVVNWDGAAPMTGPTYTFVAASPGAVRLRAIAQSQSHPELIPAQATHSVVVCIPRGTPNEECDTSGHPCCEGICAGAPSRCL